MGSNKFSRALGHLKSKSIDEKIRLLDEQPTNNTSGIYIDEPDRTTTTALNPTLNELDLTQDDPAQNGRDTSGLFMPDGTILAEEPPGDTSYILGPMAAMYYTWSYPWTMIGYIRQSDRRMVNLGRIDGKLSDWNGTAGTAGSGTGTFYSYGQLTLEQALWFRDVQKQTGATNDPSTYNYYAFYPGPPSQTPDANGRYPCVITGLPKRRDVTVNRPPTQKPINPDWGLTGYMFIKVGNKWEKKYYYNDGTTSSEKSGEMTPDNPFYDAYQRGGGDEAAENGYSRDEIIRNGNEQIQREIDQQTRQNYQDNLRKMSDKPMTIDDFKSAADYSAYKNGGGDAARAQGKSVEDIIRQGIQNIDAYDGGSRNPTPVNPDGTPYVPNVNPNIIGRTFRSATDQIRYRGDVMYQGNPTGRAPGLSNYWSPDPATAGTYSNPGAGKGVPGAKPNPTGTLTTAPRPANTPRVTRSPLGQPQFKFPKGSPPPANMITQVADDAAVGVARRAGARTAGKTLGRLVPGVSIGISLADAGYRAANGDYVGAVLSGVSAVPGPIGWLGLGVQLGGDALGVTGVKEQAESYDDYLKVSRDTIKNNGVKIDRNAMLAELLYTIAQSDQLDDEDKKFFVAILTQADGLQPDDVKSFVQRIQQKLMGKKVSESYEQTRKRILREIKNDVVLPDEKKEKLTGYRPKTYGKLHAQYDTLMQKAENPASFKPMDETTWTKRDKYFNSRLSQERKNEVLDHLGTGDHYWDILCETGKKTREKGLQEKYGDYTLVRKEHLAGDTLLFLVDENGKKETILQSEYSDRIARQMEEPLWEQETLNAPNDPLIKRIRGKLATQIDYPDKPSPNGYPEGPTPEQVDGYHPEYGKRVAYYNALDPKSADAMPATGDPEIDAKVASQKSIIEPVRVTPFRKKSKKQVGEEYEILKYDWRSELIEAMSSKDFPHIYGGVSIFNMPITSTIQNPEQGALAQDIVNASADATDHEFGPQFPGSYRNVVGGVESLSRVDAQAALGDLEDEPRNTLKRAYYSDGDATWDGTYQGPSLPTDPWNNNPTEITGTEGQDYQQVLDVRVNHGENRIATHSIRLEAGQEYDFRILKYANGRVLPAGVTYSAGSQAYFQGGTEVSISSDSVLSLQDENGALVAFNDDEFATFYNQTIGPAEYGYAIQPQPSFFPDDGTLDLVPQYTGGDVEEFVPGIDIWSQANTVQWDAFEDGGSNTQANFTFDSRITYTPTTTGTYYLALRDYRDRGSDIQYVRLRVSGRVPAAAQAVVDRRSQSQKTTDAADLGAPVAAFDPNRKNRNKDGSLRDGNPDALQLDPEIEKLDASITDPQERNLIDKAKDAVLDFAADIIGARSAKNALDSYNKFLANPKGPGSSPDKPLDITNNFTKKDISILRTAVANDAYSKDKIRQAIESSGKSQHIQDLRWEVAIGAVETAIRDASSKSEGLNNSIHGGGTLDRQAFIRSGGKEITFIKPYAFRPGGSVAQFEKSPFGRLMTATGLPADTIGAGGNPAVVVGGVIASQLMLNNAKKHGGIYKAPTAYMKVNISSGTMKESTNFDYEGKPSPNGFPDTPPPQMINGYHPNFGKKSDMYNRLDPISAKSMPRTGNPEIDAKVRSVFKRINDRRKNSGKPNS